MSGEAASVEEPVLVAAVQMETTIGDTEGNRGRALGWLDGAAEAGANVAVLPELSVTGYAPATRQEAMRLAEPIPGPSVDAWAEIAERTGMIVVGGVCERVGDRCYNAAAVVGPEGALAVYRKAHLFEREQQVFDPGDSGFPVVETPFGRVGVLICYDLRFPEAIRTLVLRGAEIVAVPTAWVTLSGRLRDERGVCIQAYCAQALASMNRVYVACASMVGPFRDTEFLGNSLITDVSGWPLAGPASGGGEDLLLARIRPASARSKRITPQNDLIRDRRPELYELDERPGAAPFALRN